MDQPRALDWSIDDLATARALIASLQEQLTKSQREIAALRHELDTSASGCSARNPSASIPAS